MYRRSIKLLSAAALAVLLVVTADAADYAAGFSIDANMNHNDNIQLARDNPISATGYGVSPKLSLSAHTETTKADLDSIFTFDRYDKSEYNTNNQTLALVLYHQFENSALGMTANYINDTTLTSELLTTGRFGNKADPAKQYTLSPNWSFNFTEVNLIQLQGTFTKQTYDNSAYIGYQTTGAAIAWMHLISDRMKLTATATYSDYESDDVTLDVPATAGADAGSFDPPFFFHQGDFGQQSYVTKTTSTGVQVGLDYQWSEQSLIKAKIGGARLQTSYPIRDPRGICANSIFLLLASDLGPAVGSACFLQTSSNTQSSASVTWMWTNEHQQLNLNANKAIQPTSNGYAVDSTQLASNWNYQLSELNSLNVNLSAARNRAIDKTNSLQASSIADRDYASATLAYARQLSDHWVLNASFQFSYQKYVQIDYKANSKSYSLGLRYSPKQWHLAR